MHILHVRGWEFAGWGVGLGFSGCVTVKRRANDAKPSPPFPNKSKELLFSYCSNKTKLGTYFANYLALLYTSIRKAWLGEKNSSRCAESRGGGAQIQRFACGGQAGGTVAQEVPVQSGTASCTNARKIS